MRDMNDNQVTFTRFVFTVLCAIVLGWGLTGLVWWGYHNLILRIW